MKPRTVSLFERICRMVTGSRSVPSPSGTPLYCAMSPETGTRAKSLSNGSTASQMAPPTFSKVDIDAAWAGGRQSRRKIRGAMIDRGVEAKLVPHEGAFLRAAGDADRSRAGELCELSDQRPDRAAGGDDHGLSGLGLADHAQAAVRGEPRHSEHAEPGRDRRRGRIELAQARAVRERVRSPSCSREDDVTFHIRGIVRDDHMRHAFSGHHLADLERRGIRLPRGHATAHVRVEGEVVHLEQKLPGCRGRDGGLLEAKVGELRLPLWSSRENNLSPTCCHDATFSLSEMCA